MNKKLFWVGIASATVSLSFGQALINSGTSQFGFSSPTDAEISGSSVRTGTSGGSNSVFVSLGAPDIQFQNWYWYRVNNATIGGSPFADTREYALSGLLSKSVTGNNMTLHYGETTDGTANGGQLFAANIGYGITNGGGGTLVTATNDIVNLTDSTLDITIFNYVDFDISGGSDSAVFNGNLNSGSITVTGANRSADIRWNNAAAYEVGTYPGVLNLMSNSSIDNLNNSGLPFGPGDFTGALQFNLVLGPREAQAIQTSYFTAPVPEPGSLLALGLGLGAWMRRRRNRK